jgi:uncharacterized membrane protein YjjP (DUF1212 family)
MHPEQLLTCALDIGEQMLVSGAEIGRVEDSIRHICSAYGCGRTDVFTITSSIVVSIEDANRNFYTQTRRITATKTDLTRLDKLNALTRRICATKPGYDRVQAELSDICSGKTYPLWFEALASALIAGSFAVFFGGSWMDGLVSAILGLALRYITWILQKARLNQIFTNVVASFLLCFSSIALTRAGIGDNVNMIIIGGFMLLIPGIALTNSLRDMISGDIMSGMLRFFDAVLVAAAIAAGFILAASLLGGAV